MKVIGVDPGNSDRTVICRGDGVLLYEVPSGASVMQWREGFLVDHPMHRPVYVTTDGVQPLTLGGKNVPDGSGGSAA